MAAIRARLEAHEVTLRERTRSIEQDFFTTPQPEGDLVPLQTLRAASNRLTDAELTRLRDEMVRQATAALPTLAPQDARRIRAEGGIKAVMSQLHGEETFLAFASAASDLNEAAGPVDQQSEHERLLARGSWAEHGDATKQAEHDASMLREILQPTGIVPAPPTATPAPRSKTRPAGTGSQISLISAVLEKWLASKNQGFDMQRKWRVYTRRFIEINGDIPVGDITKRHVREFMETVVSIPRSLTLPPKLRSGSIADLLGWADKQAAGGKPVPTLSPDSVAKHLSCIKALLEWAQAQGYCETNIARGMLPPEDKRHDAERKRPFTKVELHAVLAQAREKWGTDDDKTWIVTAAIYTGARMEELCQAQSNHMEKIGDDWVLHIKPGDGRKVKNKSSIRTIPLHPELVALGFVDKLYRQGAATRLFLSLTKSSSAGRYGHNVSHAFHRLLRERMGITDQTVRFHAFRHSFTDACRDAGVPDNIWHRLTGHSSSNAIADGYGSGHSPAMLAQWMAKIRPL